MSRCARCEAPEVLTEAADFLDPQNSAALCLPCAQRWLSEIVGFPGFDLRVFTGTATATQSAAHAVALAEHKVEAIHEAHKLAALEVRAAEAEAKAARGTKRTRQATEGGAEQRRRANAVKNNAKARATAAKISERPAVVAQLVAAGPLTVAEVAAGLGVSYKTATRAIGDAKRSGLVVVGSGRNAKVHRTQDSQQPLVA